jgi:hypothetical protein
VLAIVNVKSNCRLWAHMSSSMRTIIFFFFSLTALSSHGLSRCAAARSVTPVSSPLPTQRRLHRSRRAGRPALPSQGAAPPSPGCAAGAACQELGRREIHCHELMAAAHSTSSRVAGRRSGQAVAISTPLAIEVRSIRSSWSLRLHPPTRTNSSPRGSISRL